jgi:hypothetical protein
MMVSCSRGDGKILEACGLDIFNSVLRGRNGNQVKLVFPGNYSTEAFCFDPEGNSCLVRSRYSDWEAGRMRWVRGYRGFKAAFFIENDSGLVLGVYDAPPAY